MTLEQIGWIILGIIIGFFMWAPAASRTTINEIHDELVEQGHAEYYLDKDNKRQWRMKK